MTLSHPPSKLTISTENNERNWRNSCSLCRFWKSGERGLTRRCGRLSSKTSATRSARLGGQRARPTSTREPRSEGQREPSKEGFMVPARSPEARWRPIGAWTRTRSSSTTAPSGPLALDELGPPALRTTANSELHGCWAVWVITPLRFVTQQHHAQTSGRQNQSLG